MFGSKAKLEREEMYQGSVSRVVHDDVEFILQRLHNYFQYFLNFFLLRVQDAEILCREIF